MLRRCVVSLLFVFSIIGMTACGGGSASHVTPQPEHGQVSVSLTADKLTIDAGQFATLRWSTQNAASVTISPPPTSDDDQPQALPLTGSMAISPTTTTTYTATAVDSSGNKSTASVTVTVNQIPPAVTLTVTPEKILPGQSAKLSWMVENADTVSIDQGIGDVSNMSGEIMVSPPGTTTYTVTATGKGGTKTASATLTVASANELAIVLSANPETVGTGDSSLLTWETQNATSVTLDNGIGTVSANGSFRVTPSKTTTYTAIATDASGNTQSATITVSVVAGGGLSSIKHIIFLIQENRSFDHYFGRLGEYRQSQGLPNDIDSAPLDTVQYDRNGVAVSPYHLRTVCTENLTPSWNETHIAVDGGKMDGFMKYAFLPSTIDPDYHRAMGYYDQRDIPYYYELATQFATSDRFFASVQSGTIPNRMFLFSATALGHVFYPDYPDVGSVQAKTIFDLLDDAGVSWGYYYQDNSIWLAFYSIWNKPGTQAKMKPLDSLMATLASPDADSELPQVVFIEHGAQIATDEHPGEGKPGIQKGAALTKSILDALMASGAWPSSVFIMSYDDPGGFYDHVPPVPMPPPDDIPPRYQKDTDIRAGFDYSGLRLPLIVVSPWIKPHYVSHVPRDFTSILRLIETRFALPTLTKRDAAADDMTEFFDFSKPHWLTPPPLPAQPTDGACDWQLEKSP